MWPRAFTLGPCVNSPRRILTWRRCSHHLRWAFGAGIAPSHFPRLCSRALPPPHQHIREVATGSSSNECWALPVPEDATDAAALLDWGKRLESMSPALRARVLAPPVQADLPVGSRLLDQKVIRGSHPPLVLILGVRHDCAGAAEQATALIATLRPSYVAVELCQRRFKRLLPFGVQAFDSLPDTSKRQIRARLPRGGEQLDAIVAAHQVGATVVLADRDVSITEARVVARLSIDALRAVAAAVLGLPSPRTFVAWISLFWQLRTYCLQSVVEGHTIQPPQLAPLCGNALPAALLENVEQFAHSLLLEAHLTSKERWRRMRGHLEETATLVKPSDGVDAEVTTVVHSCVIEERDVLLCDELWNVPGPFVVAVIGVAHLDGMAQRWEDLCQRHALLTNPGDAADTSVREARAAEESDQKRMDMFRKAPPEGLSLWRRMLAQPLLWRIRGTL